ncbi:MAG: TIR domain-containing protein [Methyloligellaceae bacterium]
MARVFISHSSRDDKRAAAMQAWLEKQGFDQGFLDFDKHSGIPPGANWEKTLYREIERCDAVVLVLTPDWLESKWCWVEYHQARALGKAIFPAIEAELDGNQVGSDIQHVDLTENREEGLEKLARGLQDIAREAQFPWEIGRPPYPGLLSLDEDDAAVFFGRDDDIRRIIERLNARRVQGGPQFMAILGASGSGKSSLLRAGVLPRLRRDERNWIVLPPFRPQVRPVDEFAKAIAISMGQAAKWREWREKLSEGDSSKALHDLAEDLRMHAGRQGAHVLISIDQAEELFGTADPAQSDRYFELMSEALRSGAPFIAIAAMRSDFLDQLQTAEKLTAPFEEISLKPLPLARIPQIIRGPARVASLKIDDGLVIAAARDAATQDALPLLAFALRELYERYGQDGDLTLEEYQALGDPSENITPLENAVRKAADDVLALARPTEDQLRSLQAAFVPAMVRVNDEGEYVRRPAIWDELPVKSHPLLEQLAKARLLVIRQEGSERIVEVAHEALLRKWPRLRGWLDHEREFLIGKGQLEQDLHDWQKAGEAEKTSALLSGLKLTRARQWLADRPQQLTDDERGFVQISLDHEDAEQRRRARVRLFATWGSAAAAICLAAIATLAGFQWVEAEKSRTVAEAAQKQAERERDRANAEKDRAEDAVRRIKTENIRAELERRRAEAILRMSQETRSRFLADLANQETKKGDWKTAVLLALEGIGAHTRDVEHPYTPSAEAALHAALYARGDVHRLGDDLIGASFSRDGRQIVTVSRGGKAKIWETETGKILAKLDGHKDDAVSAAFSPDDERVLTASSDGTARIWDARTGRQLAVLAGHDGGLTGALFSSDGRRVITVSEDRTARLWDAVTSRQIHVFSGHTGPVHIAALSPDGRRLVTASMDGAVRLWDTATGQETAILKGHETAVKDAAFSADGQRLVTASPGLSVRVWNAETGARIGELKSDKIRSSHVILSDDLRRFVTASPDGTAHVWNAKSGSAIAVFKGHDGAVNSTAVSPNGRRIATASDDKTVRIWDIGKRATMVKVDGHESAVAAVAFAPDAGRLLTVTKDGQGRLWRIFPTTQALVSYAIDLAPRCLTPEQRKKFFLEPEWPQWCQEKEADARQESRIDGPPPPPSSN